MPQAYAATQVAVGKSQQELRAMLTKFGVSQFTMGEGADWAGLEFVHDRMLVRFRCPIRTLTSRDYHRIAREQKRSLAAVEKAGQDQEAARVWRVLVWSTKARLVAVDEGLETFPQAFLAHIVDPSTDQTVWQGVEPLVAGGALERGNDGIKALGR